MCTSLHSCLPLPRPLHTLFRWSRYVYVYMCVIWIPRLALYCTRLAIRASDFLVVGCLCYLFNPGSLSGPFLGKFGGRQLMHPPSLGNMVKSYFIIQRDCSIDWAKWPNTRRLTSELRIKFDQYCKDNSVQTPTIIPHFSVLCCSTGSITVVQT